MAKEVFRVNASIAVVIKYSLGRLKKRKRVILIHFSNIGQNSEKTKAEKVIVQIHKRFLHVLHRKVRHRTVRMSLPAFKFLTGVLNMFINTG